MDTTSATPAANTAVPQWPLSSHEIVSKTGYLLGVEEKFFYDESMEDRALHLEIFREMEKNRAAQILRSLCMIRTGLERNFKNIHLSMKQNTIYLESLTEYIPQDSLKILSREGVRIPTCRRPIDYVIEVNRLIQDRVNNCKVLFPSWLEWNYIRDLFIMPGGLTEQGTKEAAETYYANRKLYPYGVYMNWKPRDEGNILYNDAKFLQLLYFWNRDEFTYMGHVTLMRHDTKENICRFLEDSRKTVIVVDCENADPYRFHAVLDDLGKDLLSSVEKILLFNDLRTSVAWKYIGRELNVPVEEIITERVLDRKSLVDIRLAAETSKEFYKNGAESFILVSSDSDYFGLISALREARFLVVMEREHCSRSMQETLQENSITHCFMDDFPLDESDELKEKVILKELQTALTRNFHFNLDQLLSTIETETRAELSPAASRDLRNRIEKNIRIEIAEDGDMRIEFSRLK
ncbi:MAG: hypothetical protein PUK54_06295 [Firmicutes bacterium]|nr:hypothetical protein [Bacillota bacterium]MDD7602195.1 hypothetical protein [Bacillota bacterium]MDY5857448.1 hypothetical protein [Anaerovoracaceae bacterium]